MPSVIDRISSYLTLNRQWPINHGAASPVGDTITNNDEPGRIGTRPFIIKLKDVDESREPPYYIGDRGRYATATSVKFLDQQTLVCCSFLNKQLCLYNFDSIQGVYRKLNSTKTVFAEAAVETDLCDSDPAGTLIVVSNFYHGSCTLYKRKSDSVKHCKDLPINSASFIHGVKFYTPEIIAATAARGVTGVHFYDIERDTIPMHIEIPLKTQDLCFISGSQLVVATTRGAPKSAPDKPYASEVSLIDFDLQNRQHQTVFSRKFDNAHFDSIVLYEGSLFITDQLNNSVKVLNSTSLEKIGEIHGYDFPHGVDVRFGLIAVSNYGNNTIDIRPLSSMYCKSRLER